MKLTINAKDLVRIVKLAKKVIDKKNPLPILSCIKVDVTAGKATFSCTNLDIAILTTAECKTEGEGIFMLPFKSVENLKPEGSIEITYENSIEIKKDTRNILLKADNVEDFPLIQTDELKYDLAEDFIEKLKGCLPAVSEDECRYVLNGVCIQREAIVSTDGKRMHYFRADNPEILSLFKSGVILPGKAVKILESIAKSEKIEQVKLGMTCKNICKEMGRIHPIEAELSRPRLGEPAQVTFQIGNTILVSKLIEGRFPNWRAVISKNTGAAVSVNREQLLSAMQESIGYVDSKNPVVLMHFNKGETANLEIYTDSNSKDKSRFYTSIPAIIDEQFVSTGLAINPEFVIDSLDAIGEENVKIMLADPLNPVTFQGQNDSTGTFVLMPVRTDLPVVSYTESCKREKQKEEKEIEEKANEAKQEEQKSEEKNNEPEQENEVTESADVECAPV